MARAVLEGVAFGYRSLADALGPVPYQSKGSDDGSRQLMMLGRAMPLVGGGAKSELWTQASCNDGCVNGCHGCLNPKP